MNKKKVEVKEFQYIIQTSSLNKQISERQTFFDMLAIRIHHLDYDEVKNQVQSINLQSIIKDMQDDYSEVMQLIKKYDNKKTNNQLLAAIKQNGNLLKKWILFSQRNIKKNSRDEFIDAIKPLIGLTNQIIVAPSPIIIAFNQIVQIPISLKTIQLYSDIQQRKKNNIETSPNLNKYLQKEINYIIDLLQRGSSLEKYFQSIQYLCQTINNPLSILFRQMKFLDFLVLLKKSTGSNYQIAYLLFQQVPVSITSPSNKQLIDIRSCLSFLRCDDYSLITNIGTKNTKQNKKLHLISNFINLNGFPSAETVFETNVNLLKIDDCRKVIMADFTSPLNLISPSSKKLIEKTSLLILHTTYDDLFQIIKQPPQFLQTIQKLAVFIWDNKQAQTQISNQIFKLFNQKSPLSKSINEDQNLMEDYLIIANINPRQFNLLNNTEGIKNLLNSSLRNKYFNIHPEFYYTKIGAIEQLLLQLSTNTIKDLLLNTNRSQKDKLIPTQVKVSPFVNQCLKYFKQQNYCQFTLFAEKLSNFQIQSLSLDNIIYQVSIYNELTIDRQAQFQQSAAQSIINIYYQKCLDNFLPFNIIDQKIHQFGNGGLQRFWKYINANLQKDTFIVSVIGADSFQKSQLINRLFRYNFYMREYPLGRGLYMSLCQINKRNIIVFNTSKIINQEISKFDHQILTYLFYISNLVLITNFEKDSQRLIESLKICRLILDNILLNQDEGKICPKIFAVSQLFDLQLQQQLKYLYTIQKDDLFTISTKVNTNDYGSFILYFRTKIVNYLISKERASGNLYEIYKKQKAFWQLLNNISQTLLQSKTYQQARQNAKLIANNRLLNQQKKRQFIKIYFTQRRNKAIIIINERIKTKQTGKQVQAHEKPLYNVPEQIQQTKNISINIQRLIEQLNLFKEGIYNEKQEINENQKIEIYFSSINNQQITSLYNNINQYYKDDIRQYFHDKQLQQLQLSIDSTLYKQFKQKLATNFEESIQDNHLEISLLLQKEIQNQASLNQESIKHNLLQTFQIILESQPILEGVLSIDSIHKCVAFFNKVQQIKIINNLEYFVEIEDLSLLKQIDRANINAMIENQLSLLQEYFKATYMFDLVKETQILQNFSYMLVKIHQAMSKLLGNLKIHQQKIGKKMSLVKINFKMYLLGNFYTMSIKQLLRKKKNQSLKKTKRIVNILQKFEQKSKILIGMRDDYLKVDSLIAIEEKSLDNYKDQIQKFVDQTNIVQVCLNETIENKKDVPMELNHTIKHLYRDCFKIIKNPERYLDEKIFAQSNVILKKLKNQLEDVTAKQIDLIKDKAKQYETTLYKQQYSSHFLLVTRLRQQIRERILQKIKQIENQARLSVDKVLDDILKYSKDKFTGSICKQICPHCNARCRKKSLHESHYIRHYLKAYGGPQVKDNEFDLSLCNAAGTEVISTQKIKDYKRKLLIVWANIQDALILTKYDQAKKSQQISIIQQREKCFFLTNQDLDQEIKGLQGQCKLRDY